MTPKEILEFCKKNEVQLVDVKFCDFLGTWQHFCVPIAEIEEEVFEAGLGFDGSSIRGWKSIEASDMLLMLDPAMLSKPDLNSEELKKIRNHPELAAVFLKDLRFPFEVLKIIRHHHERWMDEAIRMA